MTPFSPQLCFALTVSLNFDMILVHAFLSSTNIILSPDHISYKIVALSQIRSSLHCIGDKMYNESSSSLESKHLNVFTIALFLLHVLVGITLVFLVQDPGLWLILTCMCPICSVDLILIVYMIYMTISIRRGIKKRMAIKDHGYLRDLISTLFCAPCVISQMSRHLADYKTGIQRKLECLSPKDNHTDREPAWV